MTSNENGTSTTSLLMSELVSYPLLLQHEEALTKQGGSTMYDVSSWMLYLEEIDGLLESMTEAQVSQERREQQAAVKQRNSHKPSLDTTVDIGGRSILVKDIRESYKQLQKARNLLSERALSLLPGSYKLWRDYLHFRSHIYINATANNAISNTNNNYHHTYPVKSSQNATRYKATISAYERSLVRMNKYPRIWLMYISFVIQNDPTCNVTNARRLFNRSLLALPATQHDLIWGDYLCFILGKVPPEGLIVGGIAKNTKGSAAGGMGGGGAIGPIVRACLNGTLSPSSYPIVVPDETKLRVLRRYAHYYNPTARELLAETALGSKRYGEAASVLLEILNDAEFLSAQGTTRHELWMKLAEICTEHPATMEESGVDFDEIVRAVLNPPEKSAAAGDHKGGRGWKIFDETNVESKDENDQDEEEKEKRKKIEAQQAQLQASLGEMEGTLWTKLAHYHIRNGEFELARSIYEEAMGRVSRVRDFSLIFDGYIKFEEGVIEALMELMDDDESEEKDADDNNGKDEKNVGQDRDDEDLDILLGDNAVRKRNIEEDEPNTSADVELALARAENLMSRRPLLLNRVLLRQNPHNVGEWLKRSDLYLKLKQPTQAIASLEEAIKTVNSRNAINGSPATLYTTLARLHEEEMNTVEHARSIYQRICCPTPEYYFKETDDLAQCYTEWVEMELRVENWDEALSIARRSVAHAPSGKNTKITRGLVRSLRLWNLLLDLEESLGTLQNTKDSYNRALELKVATPSHVLNFASYLIDKKYFEESFTAFERGVDMFPFPHPGAKLIWKEYVQEFQKRYEGTKIPRTRELFDRCLESCPPEDSSEFFLLYGEFEEKYGLTKRALGVYERMCTTVPTEEKYTAYQLYIAKTVQYLGVTATRPLYERAIAALEDNPAAQICCEYAKLEASLQEIDRARTAFTFGAQLADPRRNPEYWQEWHEFEVSHGNEETFREMLRVKRGVQAAFSTVNYNAAEMGAGVPKVENLTDDQALEMIATREGVKVNEKERIGGFVQGKRTAEIKDLDEVERRAAKLRKVTAGLVAATQDKSSSIIGAGDEEIDIDDEDNEDNDTEGNIEKENVSVRDVTTKAVPAAVFGGLASQIKEKSG